MICLLLRCIVAVAYVLAIPRALFQPPGPLMLAARGGPIPVEGRRYYYRECLTCGCMTGCAAEMQATAPGFDWLWHARLGEIMPELRQPDFPQGLTAAEIRARR